MANKTDKFASLRMQKNSRSESTPAENLITGGMNIKSGTNECEAQSSNYDNASNNINGNTTGNISDNVISGKVINATSNIGDDQKSNDNVPNLKRATFIIEQNRHRDFKMFATKFDSSMVDMLDDALVLYMFVRNRAESDNSLKGKSVLEIVREALDH